MSSYFSFNDGIISGLLRLGIALGECVAYIEVADSGVGFKFAVLRKGIRLAEGCEADLEAAKKRAEDELRLIHSGVLQQPN
jgi:hypothetical protein